MHLKEGAGSVEIIPLPPNHIYTEQPKDYAVKGGEQTKFESGMMRDTTADKVDYTLIRDGPMFKRWATHLSKAVWTGRYKKRNWMQANSDAELERFKEGAARHFEQWLRGDEDEDHGAAVFFNINGAEYLKGLAIRK